MITTDAFYMYRSIKLTNENPFANTVSVKYAWEHDNIFQPNSTTIVITAESGTKVTYNFNPKDYNDPKDFNKGVKRHPIRKVNIKIIQ